MWYTAISPTFRMGSWKHRIRILAAAHLRQLPDGSGLAQNAARSSVIVVFEDNVRFQDFQRFYSPGPEGVETPEMDVSVDHGVAGAVRFLEQRGGFHSDHIYSHTVRAFAARLTREQMLQLANDRLVSYIEPDAIMSIHQEKPPPGLLRQDKLCRGESTA